LQGDKSKAGSIVRVPAAALEALVAGAIGKPSSDRAASQADVRNQIDRVTIGRTAIQVQLLETDDTDVGGRTLTLQWTPPSPYRRREIIQSVTDSKTSARPMRANARAILLDALRGAHRWLDEILSDPLQTLESLALREGKTDRSIRMTLSLAFLAPDIVKAAVEGRLPRGYGLKRLVDLPMAWPEQWRALGLEAPARAQYDQPFDHLSRRRRVPRGDTCDRTAPTPHA
jgi:site-specific DNA recombinase